MSAADILARTHTAAPLTDVDGLCLIWEGAVQSSGYGSVAGSDGETELVHRVVYTELVRPLAWGETIDHTCRRILCVNVRHHDPVSRAENTRRRFAAQTHCKHGHPLSGKNVRQITRRNGYTYRVCITCRREVNRSWMRQNRQAACVHSSPVDSPPPTAESTGDSSALERQAS